MTLRITQSRGDPGTVLGIHGEVSGGEVRELQAVCATALRPLTIDLSEVITADAQGIDLLRSLAAEGARMVRASVYLEMRLLS